ncbi:MAG: PHP domain-containing protein [Clostridia bacterium]|nr:PHP domain-containing protein [Clostridia bacterium]
MARDVSVIKTLENADYHMHSTFSDGVLSPTQLVERAKANGIKIMALTDHDGVGGIAEAKEAGRACGVEVVAGIEFAVRTKEGIGLHMLGYDFDVRNEKLLAMVERTRKYREERNKELIAVLCGMGFEMTMEEVIAEGGRDYAGKPNMARVMMKKGYIREWKEAFSEKTFESPQVKSIKRKKPEAGEVLDVILQAGGIPVLAHPGKIKRLGEKENGEFFKNAEKLVVALKARGLMGIECFHTDHTKEDEEFFRALAEKLDLVITKGSDFHG